uniref:Ycf36 n=1 Tax=Laurencia catarinensis TaxID=197326 RepID=UPI0028D6B1D4|nr:Ycf36 [Laurencia catarinensis]WMP12492.1 Ycf36 [Laurencia catarinensis]
MTIDKSNCPVPFDQQPLNEYLSLKKNCLFSWSLSRVKIFIYGFLLIFFTLFLVMGSLLLPFVYNYSIFKILSLNLVVSSLLLLCVFIRLYLGWSYILKRLLSATIFYEESGWYDGQVWVKTPDYLTQDRLVGFYQIMPGLVRIKYVCFILIISFLFFLSCYRLL